MMVQNEKRGANEELTMSEYIPSPRDWVAEQVELYEGSQGTEGLTLRDTGLPVIIVTNKGAKIIPVRRMERLASRISRQPFYMELRKSPQGGATTIGFT